MRPFATVVLTVLSAPWAHAASEQDVVSLTDALGLPELIEVMREEGVDYARSIEEQLFPGRGGAAWMETASAIYDAGEMTETVVSTMTDTLAEVEVDGLIAFFTSPRGREIVSYEVSARRALMNEDVEEAAQARLAELQLAEDPDLDLIDRFVEANDLVESNVMGAMNSNYAFYQGLTDGGAFEDAMTESDILADVWAQEDSIRAETSAWVYSYLVMAYRPLGTDDLEAYVALSETPEGRALNRALFAGFDRMYGGISRELGAAAAEFMKGQDI